MYLRIFADCKEWDSPRPPECVAAGRYDSFQFKEPKRHSTPTAPHWWILLYVSRCNSTWKLKRKNLAMAKMSYQPRISSELWKPRKTVTTLTAHHFPLKPYFNSQQRIWPRVGYINNTWLGDMGTPLYIFKHMVTVAFTRPCIQVTPMLPGMQLLSVESHPPAFWCCYHVARASCCCRSSKGA